LCKYLDPICGDAAMIAHSFCIFFILYKNICLPSQALKTINPDVRNCNMEQCALNMLNGWERVEYKLYTSRVGTRETSCAELYATVITGTHNNNLSYSTMQKHLKHRSPRGAVRLTIIAHAHMHSTS